MTVIVIIESAALVVLAVFVVGLLYSLGDLQRRIEQLSRGDAVAGTEASPAPAALPRELAVEQRSARRGADMAGVTPLGDVVSVAVTGVPHRTLIAFLSSSCSTCGRFWQGLRADDAPHLPGDVRLVLATKGAEHESPAAVAALAPADSEPLMTSEAWRDYAVPGTPYFVLVDGSSGLVRGEGTALDWKGVADLLALASGDAAVGVGRPTGRGASERQREEEIDAILLDAGIGPGHPSLYRRPDATQ